MRARVSCATVLMLLAGVMMARAQTAGELKARADAAHGGDQAKLCLEYAWVALQNADSLFTAGDVDKAQAKVQEVVAYAQKGVDAASESGKQLKQTEIKLRKLADRMHDVGESLAFEDRAPVRQAVNQIQQMRSDLMVRMWGPQAEPKSKS